MPKIRVKYQTLEFDDIDIHVRVLRDSQQYNDDNKEAEALGISSASWPLFGQLWPSGQVLAHLMSNYDIKNKRILEVGCGIGLASLILNHKGADITATDYHPEVQNFLNKNSDLNSDDNIPFERMGWEDDNNSLGKFDLIIGSDLLYERDHIELLSTFIEKHSNDKCEVIIIDPGRGNHSKFSKKMVGYGYIHTQNDVVDTDYLLKPYSGKIIYYNR